MGLFLRGLVTVVQSGLQYLAGKGKADRAARLAQFKELVGSLRGSKGGRTWFGSLLIVAIMAVIVWELCFSGASPEGGNVEVLLDLLGLAAWM